MTLDEFRRHPAYDYYIRTLVSNCLICELDNKFDYKYVEVERKYKTNTDKMTASDYTHLFGYLNPYYRAAYSIPKRKR